MGRKSSGAHSYIVKNTFVELSPEEKGLTKRRSVSDSDQTPSPPFASVNSPAVEPQEAKMHEMHSGFALSTPSPFLYPTMPAITETIPPMELEQSMGGLYDPHGGIPPPFDVGFSPYPMMPPDGYSMPILDLHDALYNANAAMFMPPWGAFDPAAFDVPREFSKDLALGTVLEHLQGRPAEDGNEITNQEYIAATSIIPDEKEARTQLPWRNGAATSGGDDEALRVGEEKKTVVGEQNNSADGVGGNIVAGTTVMLRNIPNKYTRGMLVDQLNMDFKGQVDFVYLPIDFKNKCNVGYAFINFRSIEPMERFVEMYNGVSVVKCLPGLNSQKIAQVTPARVHGLQENVDRLRNSPIMGELLEHPEWMPLLLDEAGCEMPFPPPDHSLPAMKPRGRRPRNEDESTPTSPQHAGGEQQEGRGGGSRGGRPRQRHSRAERQQEAAAAAAARAGQQQQQRWW